MISVPQAEKVLRAHLDLNENGAVLNLDGNRYGPQAEKVTISSTRQGLAGAGGQGRTVARTARHTTLIVLRGQHT